MPASTATLRRRASRHPRVELLEPRTVLSHALLPLQLVPVVEAEPNDTVTQAYDFAALADGVVEAAGSVAAAADVDWYTFTLTQPTVIDIAAFSRQTSGPFRPVVSLYHQALDVYDPYAPYGYRLLAQDGVTANESVASLEQTLPAGSYWVAVSGDGNRYFHPFLADSGTEGEQGDYGLRITTAALALEPGQGPIVLSSDPAPGATLARSPFELWLATSANLDPTTLIAGDSVRLVFNPNGTFGDGFDVDVLVQASFSAMANELQVLPLSPFTYLPQPLAVGHYQLVLRGDTNSGMSVVLDTNGVPLGTDSLNPGGRDYLLPFRVAGVEGGTGSNDSPATAADLGDLTTRGLVQARAAIGDDSTYDPANPDPLFTNPAADVDHYRFRVSGPGHFGIVADVAAGRFGSSLDGAVSLYRVDATGQLVLVVANDNTLNTTQAADGTTPLYPDAALFAGLTAGEYYLVVSGGTNVADFAQGIQPGTGGVYDPNVSHSGMNGYATGDYVLSVLVYRDESRPEVESLTLQGASEYPDLPTRFTVRFSEAVNLPQLPYVPGGAAGTGGVSAVFLRGSDGNDYYPRLLSYDSATNTAEFLLLDRMPDGATELHLSGALGLGDLADNPLLGNDPSDPSADYVFRFTVQGHPDAPAGNTTLWLDHESNDTFATAQSLGAIFPREIQSGLYIRRDFTADPSQAPADTADFYRFEVLQKRGYFFFLQGQGLPPGTVPQVFDAAGRPVFLLGGSVKLANLDVGTYTVRVGGWTAANAANVRYDLRITLAASNENPTPLTAGPAPAYRLLFRLDGGVPNPGVVSPSLQLPSGDRGTFTSRLTLPDATPGLANGVRQASLVGSQGGLLGGSLSGVLDSLSEGPVGGVRGAEGGSGKVTIRLSFPASGGDPQDGNVHPATDEEEDLLIEHVVAPRTVLDLVFASLTSILGQVKPRVIDRMPAGDDLLNWLGNLVREAEVARVPAGAMPLDRNSGSESGMDEPDHDGPFLDPEESAEASEYLATAALLALGSLALAPSTRGHRTRGRRGWTRWHAAH